MRAPKRVKKSTGAMQRVGSNVTAAVPLACAARVAVGTATAVLLAATVAACVKNPQFTSAPLTVMMLSEASSGNRLSRSGGSEYAVPSSADPISVARSAGVERVGW